MVDFERARKLMVETQLRTNRVTDLRVLRMMGSVPREMFVPESRRPLAYADLEHELGRSGRRLAAPMPFARMVQLAGIRAEDVVLDVGCGTGYSAAVLSGIASAVVAVESDPELARRADANLSKLEIGNAAIVTGALTAGVPGEAPFDVILIEGTVEEVSPALFSQLRDGGRLVAARSGRRAAVAHLFVKTGEGITPRKEFDLSLPRFTEFDRPAAFAF